MFGLIKKMLIGLLVSIVSVTNHRKWVSLSNQKYMTEPTIDLQLNQIDMLEVVILVMTCLICVPNKTEHLNLSVFSMIKGINE